MIKEQKPQYRFGIGEWYGNSFITLAPEDRRFYASLSPSQEREQPCLPRISENPHQKCTKKGGVCSIRRYQRVGQNEAVVAEIDGSLRTTCPHRFLEGGKVYQWVGEEILNHGHPIVVKEIGFLERLNGSKRDVGRIDMILVHPKLDPLAWCALEMQAVYFSGKKWPMNFNYFSIIREKGFPFRPLTEGPIIVAAAISGYCLNFKQKFLL